MKRAASVSTLAGIVLSVLLLTTPLATAQTASTGIPGISVTGQGYATAPAETATIAIMLSSGDFYMDPAMMEREAASPTASPETDEALQMVIDALVAAGIAEDDIEVIPDPSSLYATPYGSPMMNTLRLTIESPTTDRIMEILTIASDAAADAGLYVNMVSALYGVADCDTLWRGARENAIADARAQAETQAELLDVSLGSVIASRDDMLGFTMYSGITQPNSCTMGLTDESVSSLYSAPVFDPSIEPAVSVPMAIELTFDIVPEAGATPAS